MASQFVVIHRTTDPIEAQMITELLQEEGLDARLVGTQDGALLGAAQFIFESRVEVRFDQAEEAALRVASILEEQVEGAEAEGAAEQADAAAAGEGEAGAETDAGSIPAAEPGDDEPSPPAPGTTADPSRDPTWSPLLGLCAVFGAFFYITGEHGERLLELGALTGWPPAAQLYRLVTHAFLHASVAHLAVNAVSLLLFGWVAIRLFGLGRTALVYALGLLASGIATALTLDHAAVGASGAIYTLATLALLGRLRLAVRAPALHRKRELLRVFGLLVLVIPSSLTPIVVASVGDTVVNYVAHLAGVTIGAAAGWWLRPAPTEEDAAFRRRNWIAGLTGAALLLGPWLWRLAAGSAQGG